LRDVTERKHAESLRTARNAVRRVLSEGGDLDAIAPRLLQTMGTALQLDVGFLWLVAPEAGALRSAASWRSPSLPALGFQQASRAEEAGRESEARKAAILEAALDAVITIDEAGRVLEINPAAERIFGHPRETALGRDVAELLVPADSREAYQRRLKDCLAPDGA